MRRFVSLWPAAAGAVLVLSAFAPPHLSLLVFVGLVPFFVALMNGGARRSLALGYLFGFMYIGGQMEWLQTLVVRWTHSWPLSIFTWLLAAFLGAWYFALFGWLANRCFRKGWPWMVPLLWAGIEVFRSYIPGLAFPWGLLADPLYPFPAIIQDAYFGSIYLVSAWLALGSLVIALWISGQAWRGLRPYATAFILLLSLSLVRSSVPVEGRKYAVTLGQPGIDMAFGTPDEQRAMLGPAIDQINRAAELNGSSLIVLPEGLVDAGTQMPPTLDFPLSPSVPTIFGGQRGGNPAYQTAFCFDGQKWTYADKNRLVIFGEYVPFRKWIPFLNAFQLPSGDLTPGEKLGLLDARDVKVGPLVCFEGLFPDLAYRQARNGAQLLAVRTHHVS